VLVICSRKAAAQRLLQGVYCVCIKAVDITAGHERHNGAVHALQLAVNVVLMVK
jgi:hypothetical protein